MKNQHLYDSFYAIGDGDSFLVFDEDFSTYQFTDDVLYATKFATSAEAWSAYEKSQYYDKELYKPLLIKLTFSYENAF